MTKIPHYSSIDLPKYCRFLVAILPNWALFSLYVLSAGSFQQEQCGKDRKNMVKRGSTNGQTKPVEVVCTRLKKKL